MTDAAGNYPVWVVDSSSGRWQGPDIRVKTAWIVARDRSGDLTVTARRLNGPGRALFSSSHGDKLSDTLLIPNADQIHLTPGGADADTIRRYAFHSSATVYPSSGCWELIAEYGDATVRIIVEIEAWQARARS